MPSKSIRNQYSGRRANGTRFRFQVRSITRHPIYLPLAMKKNAAVIAILNGDDSKDKYATGSLCFFAS